METELNKVFINRDEFTKLLSERGNIGRAAIPHSYENGNELIGLSDELLNSLGQTYEGAMRRQDYKNRITFQAFIKQHIMHVMKVGEGDYI